MRNLRIIHKILILSGLLIGLLLAIGITSYQHLSYQKNKIDEIVNTDFENLRIVAEIPHKLLSINNEVGRLVRWTALGYITGEEAKELILDQLEYINQLEEIELKRILTSTYIQEKEEILDKSAVYKDWIRSIGEALPIDVDLANIYLGSADESIADLVKTFERIESAFEKDIYGNFSESQERFNKIIILFLLILAFSVLVSVLVAFFIGQSIVKPIMQLREGVEYIGRGDLDYKVNVKTGDEVEQLANSFNQMTEDLKLTTTSIDKLNKEISERKKAEEALRKSEVWLSTTLKSIGDAVIATDIKGNITFMNGVAQDLTAWSQEDALGKPISDIFKIINEKTGEPAENPVIKVLKKGAVVGLANHTILIAKDGTECFIGDSGAPIKDDNDNTIGVVLVFRDVGERKKAEEQREFTIRILQYLSGAKDRVSVIRKVLELIKEYTGFEVVAMRLHEGDDYPYFVQYGFPDKFVQAENYLCERNKDGEVMRDATGNPVLDCMCGNIIRGRVDPKLPFFTQGGSFWSNCTTELLASTTEKERQARTRNRCNSEGYESVALIPIRASGKIVGLLQLNDRRKNRFSLEFIRLFEGITITIGSVLERKKAEEEIKQAAQEWQKTFDSISDLVFIQDTNYNILKANKAFFDALKAKPEDIIGKKCYQVLHNRKEHWPECPFERTKKDSKPYTQEVDDPNIGLPLLVSTSPIINEKGKLIGSVHLAKDITNLKKAEERIRKSEEQHRVLVQTIPDMMYEVDRDGKFTFVSNAIKELGYKPEELVGEYFKKIIHPDDYEAISRIVILPQYKGKITGDVDAPKLFDERRTETRVTKNLEARILLKSRRGDPLKYLSVEISSAGKWSRPTKEQDKVFLGSMGIIRDITERKKAEEAVRNLAKFPSENPAPVLRLAENGTILYANKAAQKFLANTWNCEVNQKTPDQHLQQLITESLRSGENKTIECQCKCKEGSLFSFRISPVKAAGYVNMYGEDITDRKRAERVLTDTKKELETQAWGLQKANEGIKILYKELEGQNIELQKLDQLKSDFVSTVSHELRTPLTAIKEGIGIVLDGLAGDVKKEQKDFLDTAKRNVDRLARLINDVLDFQKLQADKMRFYMQENNINEVALEIDKIMEPLVKEKGFKLSFDLEDKLPRIKCDRDRIIQVFTNLVGNAIKFTEKGSISIVTAKENNVIHVMVKDTGMGITKEDISKLFQSFQQLGDAKTRKVGGTGLGLAICKDIIEKHKGKIWAESKPGKGSTFHFTLPVKERRG